MLRLISSITPEWTDFNPADPGVALVEGVSALVAVVHYALDRAQNESYLLTAQQRSSVISILEAIDYRLSVASAASVPMIITTSGAVVIPKGFRFQTIDGSFTYATTAECIIPGAGTWTALDFTGLVSVEGQDTSESLGNSNGSQDQLFAITSNTVCANSATGEGVRVSVGGTFWEAVDSFVFSEPDSEVFSYYQGQSGKIVVAFGDGVTGKVPPLGDTIIATFRSAAGAAGNSVGVSRITKIVSGLPNLVACTNAVQPSGGADAESLIQAKKAGPRSIRTLDRAVTLPDYETLAMRVAGVSGARAQRIAALEVVVYISAGGTNPVPTGEWFSLMSAGYGLLGVVGRYLLERSVLPIVRVSPVVPVVPKLKATIVLNRGAIRTDVAKLVSQQMLSVYKAAADRADKQINLSDVIGAIEGIRGVDYINVDYFHRQPSVLKVVDFGFRRSFASLSSFRQYADMKAAELTLLFTTPTTFKIKVNGSFVRSSPAGPHKVFTVGVEESVEQYSLEELGYVKRPLLRLTLALNTEVVTEGSKLVFFTDNYLGNIVFADSEVPVPTLITAEDGSNRIVDSELELTYGGGVG
jgi:hypothetical protein